MTAETSNAREWVLVPRELTQGMRSALARAVNASCNTDEWYAHTLAAAPQPPSAPVGVDAPGSRSWMAEVCRAAALSLASHGVRNDQLSKVADWIAQQPAAPSGEAVEKWGQSYRCGCFLGFPTKAAIPGHCPYHLRDKNGTPLPLDAAPQQPAAVDEAMVERAWVAFCENNGSARQGIRAALTTALATQRQEPKP